MEAGACARARHQPSDLAGGVADDVLLTAKWASTAGRKPRFCRTVVAGDAVGQRALPPLATRRLPAQRGAGCSPGQSLSDGIPGPSGRLTA